MRIRQAIALFGALVAAGAARAAESEAEAANHISNYLQWQLFRWGIWTTGISRLDNAELFGLTTCVILMGFGVSGLGIILFKNRGLGFRSGWILSIPVILASMLAYSYQRPYPTMQDAPSMLAFAALAALVVVTIGGVIKSSMVTSIEKVVEAPPVRRDAALEKRLKMAVRPSNATRR